MVKNLTHGSPLKCILGFAAPMFLGMLFQQVYNMVDTMIVGRFLGLEPLAGVGSTGSLYFLVIGSCTGICSGFAIPVAQSFGAQDDSSVRRFVTNSVWLSAALSVVLTTLTVCLCRNMLTLMNTPEEAFEYAYMYIVIIFAGIPTTFLYNVSSAIIRALGDSRTPLIFLIISSLLNIALDLVFILLCNMNVAGAALATIISQGISVLLCAGYLGTHGFIFDFKPSSFKIHGDKVKLLIKIGLPSSVQSFVTNLSFLMMTAIVNGFGVAASAAVAVCGKFNSFGIMPALAMSSSVSSLAAQNIGAGKYDRAVEALKVGLKISVVIGIAVFAFTQLCPQLILEMFNAEPAVIDYGVTYLRAFCFDYLIVPFVFCINGLMLGAGHSMFSLVNNMLSAILLRVPVAYFVSKTSLGLAGVGAAAPAASLASLIVGVWFLLSGRWKKNSTGIHRRGAAEA